MKKSYLFMSTSLLACTLTAHPAPAQTTQPPAPAPATTSAPVDSSAAPAASGQSADDSALKDIIVTAERRFSTAQKTAASISVRSGADMLLQGRYELKNIIEDVPGITGGAANAVNTSLGSGTDNPASGLIIRGIQSNSGAGGSITSTAAASALYVDDVYNGLGGSYDIGRVEVLRGPQGTLYGRSATAGVVAIHTNDPDTSNVRGQATVEIGDYALRHFTGSVNIPIVKDKFAIIAAGNRYQRDGYYSADGGALSTTEFRVKALWTPTTTFSALLGYAQQYNVTHSGGISISQGNSPTDFVFTKQDIAPGRNHSRQYWANFNLDLGSVAITYIPAYRTFFGNALLYARGAFNANQTQLTPVDNFWTHEFRIRGTNTDAKFKWQAGFLYYNNRLRNTNDLFNLDLNIYNFKSSTQKSTKAAGGFAEGTYSFTPQTRLTAGVRYDHTEVRVAEVYTSVTGVTATLSGDAGLRKFNNFTYKARLEHDLSPENLLYASIATGFSPGDVTLTTDANFNPIAQPLKAQTLTAYEIGSKNRFLNDRLQINVGAFYYDYGGYQTGINISPVIQIQAFEEVSVPVKTYGAEVEFVARPWARGTFNINASYTRSRFGDFGKDSTGQPLARFFASRDVFGVPPFQVTAAYDHRIPIGGATLLLRGDVRFVSSHYVSRITQQDAAFGGLPYVRVGDQAVADVNATLAINPHLSLTAYVRNLTDNRYLPENWNVAAVAPGPGPGAPPLVIVDAKALSDPRTFGVILNFKY